MRVFNSVHLLTKMFVMIPAYMDYVIELFIDASLLLSICSQDEVSIAKIQLSHQIKLQVYFLFS